MPAPAHGTSEGDPPTEPDARVLVVFGARNVGRAVADRLSAGWRALAVARSDETLARLSAEHPGVVTLRGDASDPAFVEQALARAERDLGGLDLVVNAVTAVPRDHRAVAQFGAKALANVITPAGDTWTP